MNNVNSCKPKSHLRKFVDRILAPDAKYVTALTRYNQEIKITVHKFT